MTHFLQTVIDALSLGSLYALAALGIGLLFGIMRLINFAHGDFIAIVAYALIVPSLDVTARLFIGNFSWPILLMAVMTVGIVVALSANALVFRRMRSASPQNLMVVSFALGYVIQNLLMMVYGARPKGVGVWSSLTQVVEVAGLRVPLLQAVTIGATVFLLLAILAFMRLTPYGVQMRAAAEDFKMARYLGVRAEFVIGLAFAISGLLAAVVSLLFVVQTGVLSPTMGVNIVIFAFIATVIGGMGSLVGAVLGGFAVGAATSLLQAYLPADIRPFRDTIVFALVIVLLLVRPSGLIRLKQFEERV
ncbi:branched-chain amino acid ABC transporter permease [Rhizobium etli]|uniref:branched-chain amino acid ABC transporter permease n=1 Tax=Rhizobium etli TaxID=29449 RepID=UPI0003839F76|nr:branched-chain amino acid ABC transporter permease [Rhizobium etli]AGS26570.1 high-affinity branched-chain amino acid ABC transporter permease protein [Rhizobium etli bv. mimosae str. Mim1]